MMLVPLQRRRRARTQVSTPVTIPPPIEGWVSENDPKSLSFTTARIMQNLIPRRRFAESRMGFQNVATVGAFPVESLISFNEGAVSTLLGAANGKLYDVPLVPVSPGDVIPGATEIATGFSNNRWQHIVMANASDDMKAVMVNGQDGVWVYDDVDGVEKANTTPQIDDLSDVTNFKERLWFVQDGTATLYYADVLSNKPTNLTPFYVGPLLREGGNVVAIDSVSVDGGSGPDDYFVIVTSEGELIAFSGIDPASDFSLVGIWKVSKPTSVNCFAKLGKDLYYYGTQGPEAVSKLMGGLGKVDVLGNSIQDEFENVTKVNRGTHGWGLMLYTKDSWVICNVPIIAGTQYDQFVLNLETRGWFRITGWNGQAFIEHDGELYFGDSSGNISIANYGMSDAGLAIEIDWMQNWNEYGTPDIKKFNNCKLTLRSISKPRPKINMMTDYVEREPSGTTDFPLEAISSPWDVSPWNISPWSASPFWSHDIFGLTNQGFVGALRYQEKVKDSYTQIYGAQVLHEPGEIL